MDLLQLEYFRTVARLGNMTKAAAELHIAQPSLSVSIAKLEAELGTKLFDRVAGRIRLNNIGQCFYRQTDRIFLAVQDAKQEVSDLSDRGNKLVRFATTASNMCLGLLSAFYPTHMDYQFEHFMHTLSNAQSLLEEGEIDFILSTTPIETPLIQWVPLFKERILVLASTQHPLSRKKMVQYDELFKYQFVVMKSAFHPEGEFADFFKQAGFPPPTHFTTNEFEVMVQMVKLNVGIAILTEKIAESLCTSPGNNLVTIPIDTDYVGRSLGIARLEGHYFTKAAQEFYDFTVSYYSSDQ